MSDHLTPAQRAYVDDVRARHKREMEARRAKQDTLMVFGSEIERALLSEAQKLAGDDTEVLAEFLGNMAAAHDYAHFGLNGGNLALEWMADHYMGFHFERHVLPKLGEIRMDLVKHGATAKNPFDYNDGDDSAYIIPHAKLKVMVCGGKGGHSYLIIEDTFESSSPDFPTWVKLWVRQIYPRSKKRHGYLEQVTLDYYNKRDFDMHYQEGDHFTYGDIRDQNYVVTYDNIGMPHRAIEGSLLNSGKILRWFFDIGVLHSHLELGPYDAD